MRKGDHLDYTTFTTGILNCVKKQLGEEVEIRLQKIPKNNGVFLDGLAIMGEGAKLEPVICLDSYYQEFRDGKTMEELGQSLAEEWKANRVVKMGGVDNFADFQKAIPHICYQLINLEKNRALLETMPHREFLDLALVYYYRTEYPLHSAHLMIRSEHIECWGISEEVLHETAEKNTRKVLPCHFMSIGQVIAGISGDEEVERMAENCRSDEGMYVLTNEEKYLGAVCIVYPGVLKRIADTFCGSFFILPSSIHECIIVPELEEDYEKELQDLVCEVNRVYVSEEEVLSDSVYYYEREKERLWWGAENVAL